MDGDLLMGVLMTAFGTVTLVLRFVAPESRLFSKLQPMKERWGDVPGLTLHFVAYTVLPLSLGLMILSRHL